MEPLKRNMSSLTVALCVACLVCVVAVDSYAASARALQYRLQPDELGAFAFELTRDVITEAEPAGLVPRFTSHVSGELQRYVARVFRDGSIGMVARVVSLEGAIERGEQRTPLDLDAVDGRSLSLRLERGGEMVDSYGWQQLRRAGAGDLFDDVFLQSLVRLPRRLPEGGGAESMTYRSVILVEEGLSCAQTWVLSFQRSREAAESCTGSCVVLEYEGQVQENCVDAVRDMERHAEGEISGQIVLAGVGLRRTLRAHRWRLSWDRRLVTQSSEARSGSTVRQQLVSEGSLEEVEPSP